MVKKQKKIDEKKNEELHARNNHLTKHLALLAVLTICPILPYCYTESVHARTYAELHQQQTHSFD